MEDGLNDLRRQMSRCADARALGLDELEEFVAEVARRWNSAPFAEGVAEFAQQLGNCGDPGDPGPRDENPPTWYPLDEVRLDPKKPVVQHLDKLLELEGPAPSQLEPAVEPAQRRDQEIKALEEGELTRAQLFACPGSLPEFRRLGWTIPQSVTIRRALLLENRRNSSVQGYLLS